MSRVVRATVRANLTRLVRDRTAFFFIGVLPLLIVFLVGLSFGGGGDGRGALPTGLLAPTTPLAQRLVDAVEGAPGIDVRRVSDEASLRDSVRDGDLVGGVILSDDYDRQVAAGSAAVELVTGPSGTTPAALQRAVAGAIAAEDARLRALALTGLSDDEEPEAVVGLLALADEVDGTVEAVTTQVEADGEDEGVLVGALGAAARNLVLFVFITSLVGGAAVIQSRRLGVTRRALAAPTTAGQLLVGEGVSRFLIALGQAAIVLVGSAVLFGVTWRGWLATSVVVVLFAAVGTAVAMLIGATMRSEEQAGSVAPLLGIGLGMLGGCMWPLEIVPRPMQVLGHLTPHAWAVDALQAVQGRGAGLADVALEVGVLAAFALGILALAVKRMHRTLTT